MSNTRFVFIVAAFGLLLYLPGLNADSGITGKDEYLLSLRTPIEMLEQGQYLTPFLDHEPRLKKPPLVYWLILANYKVFGISLISARIWGVLFAIGLSITTGLIFRGLWKEKADLLTPALVVLSCAGVSVQARMAMLDLPLAFFVTLSIYLYLRWKDEGERTWLLLSSGACALSVLVKGPVGFIIVVLAVLLNMVLMGGARELMERRKDWLWAGVVFAVVAAPWPVLMLVIWKGAFVKELFSELIHARFLSGRSTGPQVVLGGILALLLPWSFLYLRSFVHILWQGLGQDNRRSLWLIAWGFVSLLPFLLLKVKFERYLLVAVPPSVIMLCAVPYKSRFWKAAVFKGTSVMYGLVGFFIIAFGFWFQLTNALVLALLLLSLALFCLILWKEMELKAAAAIIGVFHMLVFGFLYHGIGVQATPHGLVSLLRENSAQVYYYKGDNPGFLSMHLNRSVQRIKNPQQLVELSNEGIFLIVEETMEEDFREASSNAGITIPEPALKFSMFYSRVAWIRFARKDATSWDWEMAIKKRSLEDLKTRFSLYFLEGSSSTVTGET